jgi:hypothetical protein
MRRNTARFTALGRIACLLLLLAAAGAGVLRAGEAPPARPEAWPLLPAVVLELLGVRPPSDPAAFRPAPPPRGGQPGAPGRHHGRRFVPLCGVEGNPNGGCL